MKRYLLLFVCLAIFACAPPYIADLDAPAALTRQLTRVGTIGVVSAPGGSLAKDVKFLPVKPTVSSIKDLDVQSGFLISRSSALTHLTYAYMDGDAQINSIIDFPPVAGADPNYPLYEFDVTATTTTANILVFYMDPTLIARKARLITAPLSGGSLTDATGFTNPVNLNALFTGSAVGAQVSPRPLPTSDYVNFLATDGAVYTEVADFQLGGVSLFTGGTPVSINNLLNTPPSGVNRFLYYRTQDGTLSYASYYAGGQWVCYQWTSGTPPVILSGVTHRIDALLTTGELLSTEGGTLRLYDPSGASGAGKELLSVELNGVQFCYEAYVGSKPYVFFSLSLGLLHDKWAFNVYAIESKSIRDLKG
jgi:hypothetical protein